MAVIDQKLMQALATNYSLVSFEFFVHLVLPPTPAGQKHVQQLDASMIFSALCDHCGETAVLAVKTVGAKRRIFLQLRIARSSWPHVFAFRDVVKSIVREAAKLTTNLHLDSTMNSRSSEFNPWEAQPAWGGAFGRSLVTSSKSFYTDYRTQLQICRLLGFLQTNRTQFAIVVPTFNRLFFGQGPQLRRGENS